LLIFRAGRPEKSIAKIATPRIFAGLSIINPDYLANLTTDPMGRKVILGGIVLMIAGNLWIRKLIALEI